ncbi:electron transfer flavoprotein subunit beta/FixA family protein [Frisingicoccus sp.]|uniref:electron transfer flavoprotein subunit beta/FixA family protein n=1 Tax=Frisingicoccus sp. TaxID=1918627 RepID=UPI002E9AFDC4|nr:electron transfer flavoprotein subunit beta/FixA family protein [Frisingicoccus sp.]
MNIYVLIKQIPVISDIKINPQTFSVDRSNTANMMNPADLNALEAALSLKAAQGGTVTVLSMGNESCETQLRETAAIGADRLIRITDEAFCQADTLVTAKILAAAIRHLGEPDVIFCGQSALDGATGQIGGKLAAMLGFGLLSSAYQIQPTDDGLTIHRKAQTGYEVWQANFPVVCSVVEGSNKPRSVTVRGKMAAKKAVIEVLTNAELNINEALLVSPSIVEAIFPTVKQSEGISITGTNAADSANKLANVLFEKNLA